MKFINLMGLMAGVTTSSLLSFAVAAESNIEEVQVQESLSVCLGEQHMIVPLVPQLQIIQPDGSLKDFRSLDRMTPEQLQKIFDEAPLKAKLIILGSPSERSSQPPLLETMLGKSSPYKISELRLYGGVWADFDTWMGTFPKNRTLESGTELFVPTHAKLFRLPVKVSCNRGLVLNSEDPKRRNCLLEGLRRNNSMVTVKFNTASDLEGHWPVSAFDWEYLDMRDWSKPLSDLEKAIQNTEVKDTGKKLCN